MQQLTSGETFGLMEAYASIYDSQEPIEGQYLYEMPAPATPEQRERIRRQSDPAYDRSRFERPRNAGVPLTSYSRSGGTSTLRPKIGSLPTSARQVTQYPQGVSTGVGGGNAGASRPTPGPTSAPAPRTSAPAPRTSAPAPRTSAPAAKVTPPAPRPSAPAASTPSAGTSAPKISKLRQDIADLQQMGAASRQRQGLTQSFDVYDVVIGHLIDEGYADTEESAIAIMANMSEEWRESIIEGYETISDKSAELMRRREASLRPGRYPGDVGDNWKKANRILDVMSKAGIKPI
jgi:hypothetical protein